MAGYRRIHRVPDPRERPVTTGILTLLIVVYVGQLLVAGSQRSGAAFTVATDLPPRASIALSPWLHSSHGHVIGNAIGLVLVGGWTELQVDSHQFSLVVLATGYVANLGPYLIGIGGLAVGASGILNAVWTYFGLVQLRQFAGIVADGDATLLAAGRSFVLYFGGMLVPLAAVAQHGGMIDAAPGAAIGTHLVGVGIGGLWFGVRRLAAS